MRYNLLFVQILRTYALFVVDSEGFSLIILLVLVFLMLIYSVGEVKLIL